MSVHELAYGFYPAVSEITLACAEPNQVKQNTQRQGHGYRVFYCVFRARTTAQHGGGYQLMSTQQYEI